MKAILIACGVLLYGCGGDATEPMETTGPAPPPSLNVRAPSPTTTRGPSACEAVHRCCISKLTQAQLKPICFDVAARGDEAACLTHAESIGCPTAGDQTVD